MRKARLRLTGKKLDWVLTAARYLPDGERLALARGYRRTGDVWTDLLVFDREEIVRRLQQGGRIFVGREAELPGDFVVDRQLRQDRSEWLIAGDGSAGRDSLGLPLF